MDKFIEFGAAKKSDSGKTLIWPVTARDGVELGEIRWFGRWRTYAFYPEPFTVFERHCLRKIADFCEAQTLKLRAQWRANRVATKQEKS